MTGALSTEDGRVLATRLREARTPFARMRGLLGSPPLAPGEALVIEPAGHVHTFGMRYAIDVVFCDRGGRILHIERRLEPRRMSRWVRGARFVVELPAGAAPAWLQVGDSLQRSAR